MYSATLGPKESRRNKCRFHRSRPRRRPRGFEDEDDDENEQDE